MLPRMLKAQTLATTLFTLGLLFLAPAEVEAARGDLQEQIQQVQNEAFSALVNIQPVTETFTRGEKRKRSSVGSGFLIDKEGHIVTNYHVAGRASQLIVTLSNKERVEAELIGEDPLTDLAVIKIPADTVSDHNLKPLRFGHSKELAVGQFVLALGSPLALARTMTFGIVSNTERYLRQGMSLPTGERTGDFNTWIQTDAAINPGNSGGPLIDLSGRVVGVNARGATMADNIGFAIPASTASAVVTSLIEKGQVHRSYAGVHFQPLKDWEDLFGMQEAQGVLVSSVEPGGPAEAAGLQAGDVLLSLDGVELSVRFDEEVPALYQQIADSPVGGTVPLRVLRRGQQQPLKLQWTTVETGRLSGDRFEAEAWDFAVKGITDQMVFDLELISKEGVLVEGVKTGGAAHRGRLRRGTVIEAIEDLPVVNLKEFKARYASLSREGKTDVLLRVRSYESLNYVLIKGRSQAPSQGQGAQPSPKGAAR